VESQCSELFERVSNVELSKAKPFSEQCERTKIVELGSRIDQLHKVCIFKAKFQNVVEVLSQEWSQMFLLLVITEVVEAEDWKLLEHRQQKVGVHLIDLIFRNGRGFHSIVRREKD